MGMRARGIDAVVSLAVAGAGLLGVVRPGRPGMAVAAATAMSVTQAAPLLWRRRAPLVALAACTAIVGAVSLLRLPPAGPLLGTLAAAYAVGAYASRGLVLAFLLSVPVVAGTQSAPVVGTGPGGPSLPAALLSAASLHGLALLAGRSVRTRRETAERRVAEAVTAERTRIARELHDIVAHHVSAMVIQAGAARRVLPREPARAEQALGAIEHAGRQALSAMPALLGALRGQGADGRDPAASAGRIDELVQAAQQAGLRVRLRVEGQARPLPPGVDTSAYRIVQEALTNAVKHAGPATVDVLLRYGPDSLEVRVEDDGRGPREQGRPSSGFGLVGMAERVALLRGTLRTGPRAGGGFAVHAVMPTVEAG